MIQQEIMVFCTLFDSNYLDKGLALYRSMENNINVFKLYIFAFDSKCFEILSNMKLKHVVVLSVEDLMTVRLEKLQEQRTRAEFCWTCTPLVVEYVLLNYNEKICTYLDADIYFFSSPGNIIQEIIDNGCSVGLVKHCFERNYEYGHHIFSVGKYCVQFNTFFNNKDGMQVLKEWKENCLEWCYCRYEDGKLGDQKYLDKWKLKYNCIYESQDLGAGVAPWNLHLYSHIEKRKGKIWLKYRNDKFQVVFFHFEGMKYLDISKIYLNLWKPYVWGTRKKVQILYGEYFEQIALIRDFLRKEYNIGFEHMILNEVSIIKDNLLLTRMCTEYGLLDGLKKWMANKINNEFLMIKF